MEKTNWFHRGVELNLAQCDLLEPLRERHFGEGFPSYEAFEAEVDRLLYLAGCPIDTSRRAPTMIEQGATHNAYSCQLGDGRGIVSQLCEAPSLRGAARLFLAHHAQGLSQQAVSSLVDQFTDDAVTPFEEVLHDGRRIRVTMMLSGGGRHMNAAMLCHQLIIR
ncbi:hypothetical protein [Pseudomonas aeruginosa]|uniref:hypothetical protein n=1 Tax=Pseudomonas aeruginosa TaxID=287 RepID=UPI0032B3C1E0